MGLAEWSFGYADGWGGLQIPAACSDAGYVTDCVMYTTEAGPMRIILTVTGSLHFAEFEFGAGGGLITKSLYDPTIYHPWDGADPFAVGLGEVLWAQLDGANPRTNSYYLAVVISSVPGGLPPVASAIGAGRRSSGARIAAPRIPRGFTG